MNTSTVNTALPPSILQTRESAQVRAQNLGQPQRRTEAYRYLNLKVLRETEWKVVATVPSASELAVLRSLVREQALPGRDVLTFWNGHYVADLSTQPAGIQIKPWLQSSQGASHESLQDFVQWWSSVPEKIGSGYTEDYFDAMNESHWGRGAMVQVAAGVHANLQMLFICTDTTAVASSASSPAPGSNPSSQGSWNPYQVGVDVAQGSTVDIVEKHISGPSGMGLKSPRWVHPELRVMVRPGASVQWTQWQKLATSDICIERSRFVIGEGAKLEALHISSGAQIARQNIDFHVIGEKANVTLNGVSLVGPGQVTDFHTLVDHAVGNSTTQQLYKGILGSDSQVVFNGRVVIRKGAQKASSEQLNQNLMLSDRAEIDSKPELEIFADDVKATHGSAIGQLNEDEVFYLLSRGIPRAQAQEMIALGSVVGLLEGVQQPELKQELIDGLSTAYRRLHD